MVKADTVWYKTKSSLTGFPMAMATAASRIASKMGVSLDPRSVISPDFKVPYPNDYTMREVLSHIAVANVGNWVISDAGLLRLIRLNDVPEETNLLVDNNSGSPILFGEVRIIV